MASFAALLSGCTCACARAGDGLRLVTFDHATPSDGQAPLVAGIVERQRSTGLWRGSGGIVAALLAGAAATLLGLGAGAAVWDRPGLRRMLGAAAPGRAADASHRGDTRVRGAACLRDDACLRDVACLRDMEALLLAREASLRAMQAALLTADTARRRAEAEADRAVQAKGDFLACVSHEIRTPLNAVLGFADLLLAEADLSATSRRRAERIRGGGAALLSVVNDILEFAQAEAGALRLEPRSFALPLLVDECLALVEAAAVEGGLALRVELDDRLPAGVLGDDARLRQVLLNLLNNAIKFTPRGTVALRIGLDRAGGPIRFAVTDSGIGIDAADLPNLFQRFGQVDGTMRRARGGTGLGLATCKALVELMGGALGVTSTKGVGSTFWFAVDLPAARLELPATPLAMPATPLALGGWSAPVPAAPRALHLLLVEDIKVNQELVRAVLEARGHRVDVVGDGAEAIMAVTDAAYDLVLMDLQMPYVDGLSATRAIRALPHPGRAVPIVALSANVRADRTAAALAAGMDGCLAKPLDFDALDAILDAAARGTLRAPDAEAGDDGGAAEAARAA